MLILDPPPGRVGVRLQFRFALDLRGGYEGILQVIKAMEMFLRQSLFSKEKK